MVIMAASKASRELEAKRTFAALYSNGPEHIRGNWTEAARLASIPALPIGDEDASRMILEEGGTPPGRIVGAIAQQPAASAPDISDWRSILNQTPTTSDEWCEQAKRLSEVAEDIANGTVKATAAQASMLKHAFDRCYGRVQEKASDKKPASGVLILPMLSSGPTAMICPHCGYEVEKQFSNDAREEGAAPAEDAEAIREV